MVLEIITVVLLYPRPVLLKGSFSTGLPVETSPYVSFIPDDSECLIFTQEQKDAGGPVITGRYSVKKNKYFQLITIARDDGEINVAVYDGKDTIFLMDPELDRDFLELHKVSDVPIDPLLKNQDTDG